MNAEQGLALAQWKEAVDDIAPSRPLVVLTGGEPLLFAEIGDLLSHPRLERFQALSHLPNQGYGRQDEVEPVQDQLLTRTARPIRG